MKKDQSLSMELKKETNSKSIMMERLTRKSSHYGYLSFLFSGITVLFMIQSSNGQCSDYNSMGYCYELNRAPMTWDDAQNYCSDRGGRLVSIYNESVQNAVISKLAQENYTGDFWTGGRQEEPDDWIGYPQSLWRWVKNCSECGLETACHGNAGNPLDLAFVIDNSNGVSQNQINDITNDFIQRILQPMTIGENNVKVSIVRMSDSSGPTLPLSSSRVDILNTATQTTTSGASRNIVSILSMLQRQVFSGSANRANVPNVVIFFTDGATVNSLTDLQTEATRAKDSGIRVYAVGVSRNVREEELIALSALPKKLLNTYYMYNSTTDMKNMYSAERIRERICAFHRLYLSLQSEAIIEQGCWIDRDSRDLPNQSQIAASTVEPETCRRSCETNGFVFAGTQVGNQCYCGNKFGSYNSTTTCMTRCSANNTLYCGGSMSNSIYKVNGRFSSWAFNNQQPNNLKDYQWCGTLDNINQQRYDDQNCNMEYNYLCELYDSNCTTSPTNEYFSLFGKCLYLSNSMDTWYRARNFCLRNGRNLFVMEDESQRLALHDYLTNVRKFNQRHIYIGLNRNRYYWIDETGGTEMVYNAFAPKEPQPTDGVMPLKCVYMNPKQEYNWYTSSCAQNFSFICHYRQPSPGFTGTVLPGVTTTQPTQQPPVTGGPTSVASVKKKGFPAWAIGLIAGLLGALLLLGLLLLLLCCCCGWCAGCACWKRIWKVESSPKVADARPKAPIPQRTTVGKMDDINETYSISSSTAYML